MASLSIPRNAAPRTASLPRRIALSDAGFAMLLLALGVLPLLWPSIPPLTDVPNHMSHYRVGLDFATSSYFHTWFDFHWVLVGNLGVDLLVTALAPLIGLEPATKFAVMLSPIATIGGALLIAYEVHGRLPRTTAIAAVFAYNWVFNFGFINFTLSAGLALLVFGMWLRLGRLERPRLRVVLIVPAAFLVWLCHAAGWGILGIMIFTWEIADARQNAMPWRRALPRAALICLLLATPLLPMLLWSSHVPSGSVVAFIVDPTRKLVILFLALRNGIPLADFVAMLIVFSLAVFARSRPGLGYDKRLLAVAAALFLAFAVMPSNLIGSSHADLRLAPYAILLLMLAIRSTADTPYTRVIGAIALLFFAGEMGFLTVCYISIARAQEHQLEAIDHIPIGTTVFGLAKVTCAADMEGNRMDHLQRIATVRRQAFTNGSWPYPALQTMIVKPEMTRGYPDESSQLWEPADCRTSWRHSIAGALATVPRDRYRYFWLLNTPRQQWPTRSWLRPVWHNDATILYAIAPVGQRWKSATPARRLTID